MTLKPKDFSKKAPIETYKKVYVCVFVFGNAFVYVCVCVHVRVCLCLCVYVCSRVQTCLHKYVCVHACIYVSFSFEAIVSSSRLYNHIRINIR